MVVFLKNTLDVRGVAVGYLVVCHPPVEGGERDAATVHYAVAERDCVSLVEDVFVLLSYHCFVVFVSLYKKGGGDTGSFATFFPTLLRAFVLNALRAVCRRSFFFQRPLQMIIFCLSLRLYYNYYQYDFNYFYNAKIEQCSETTKFFRNFFQKKL